MVAGARTKCQEKEKRRQLRKLKRLTEFWAREFANIDERNMTLFPQVRLLPEFCYVVPPISRN